MNPLASLKALTVVFFLYFFLAGGAVQETSARAPEPVCVAQGAISSGVCGYFGHTEAAGGGGAALIIIMAFFVCFVETRRFVETKCACS